MNLFHRKSKEKKSLKKNQTQKINAATNESWRLFCPQFKFHHKIRQHLQLA